MSRAGHKHAEAGAGTFVAPTFASGISLRQQATDVLRGAVITGALAPGTLVSAPQLAAQFGVSATPVREAMLDLAREGLIDTVRNKGFRVTDLTDRQLDDMTHLRMLIEVPTCAEIADRSIGQWADEIARLRGVADEIVRGAENGDLIAYVEADRRFHLGLLALSGNDELVATVGSLRARSRLYGLDHLARTGTLGRSAAEHGELLDAIEAGDPNAAASVMRRHIHHVRGWWAGRSESDSRASESPASEHPASEHPPPEHPASEDRRSAIDETTPGQ